MSDHLKKEQPEQHPESDSSSSHAVYHWCYSEQQNFDRQNAARQKRTGIFVYAITMSIVLCICILVLAWTLIWYQNTESANATNAFSVISEVAEEVKPATVLIEAVSLSGESYGTGFILTDNGYLATNYHVIKNASEIFVTPYVGERSSAELVGYYEPDDLAVLKINGSGFPTVKIGHSADLTVGELVVAIGNPANGEAAWTTTHGIISALNRRIAVSETYFVGTLKMLQTDAPVNPGNSGGPLCNADGEVIGIVSRKLNDYEGIGFAIPIDEAIHTLHAILSGTVDQLESTVSNARPTIGIVAETIRMGEIFEFGENDYVAECNGILVTAVSSGSAADQILEFGDILIEFDGNPVSTVENLQNLLYRYRIGDRVTIKLLRRGEQIEISLTLEN